MNIALWAVQIILALIFIAAGSMKVFQYEKFKASMPWAKEYPKGFVVFVGMADLLGGLGLIIPYATDILPVLTPIAAIGLAVVMALATAFHIKRKEYEGLVMNIVLFASALFIAIGRML